MYPGSAGTLPTGYQQQIDPSTGKAFYVNLMTGETSWTPPTGAAAAPVPMTPSAAKSSAGLPPGWEERVDPASGRKFYINHANKSTSWELPTAGGSAPPSQPSYAAAPRQASPDSRLEAIDRDAALARELAEQWNAEAGDDSGNDDEDDDAKGAKKEWASDASTTNCFLTDVKFGVVQRKHHCRYCGQIFVAEVCKRTAKIPSMGFDTPVRVCDVCFDQIQRGDPVCVAKQVALLRSQSEAQWQQGAKVLADWAAMDPQFATAGVVQSLDALKLPELLPQLLDGTSAATQGAIARLLAAVLQHDEYREMLGRVDLLEPLLSALKSSSTDTKVKSPAPQPPAPDS